MKKTLLLGRGTIAVNCLNILNERHQLPRVVICDTKDSGQDTWTKSLYKRAQELGFIDGQNLFRETKVNKAEFIDTLKKTCPEIDIIFSIQPYAIFRMPFIQLARDYVVNMHFAPLPKLRGVAPCSWAFIDGLDTMGVTLHLIQDEGIDNGPIIFQKLFPITQKDTAWTLHNRCVQEGTQLFQNHIASILSTDITPEPQVENDMTYHPMQAFDFQKQELMPEMMVAQALAFVRSRIFPPIQMPYIVYEGRTIYIKNITRSRSTTKTIIKKTETEYIIPLQDGCVKIQSA